MATRATDARAWRRGPGSSKGAPRLRSAAGNKLPCQSRSARGRGIRESGRRSQVSSSCCPLKRCFEGPNDFSNGLPRGSEDPRGRRRSPAPNARLPLGRRRRSHRERGSSRPREAPSGSNPFRRECLIRGHRSDRVPDPGRPGPLHLSNRLDSGPKRRPPEPCSHRVRAAWRESCRPARNGLHSRAFCVVGRVRPFSSSVGPETYGFFFTGGSPPPRAPCLCPGPRRRLPLPPLRFFPASLSPPGSASAPSPRQPREPKPCRLSCPAFG
jgi:hypothetical protein